MTEPARAEIVSFDCDSPDRAILTFTVNHTKCRVAFGFNHVEIFELQVPRVLKAMKEARDKAQAQSTS